MGYKDAQQLYKKRNGKSAKSSWIASVLFDYGKTSGPIPSRKDDYKYPCPDNVKPKLEKILRAKNAINIHTSNWQY